MGAPLGEQRGDRSRRLDRQRDLDEDQRLVDQRGVEEGVAAAVRRIDAPPELVPVADFMHRLVADDLLEDRRRRGPVDAAQHEKAAIEPGAEQVLKIAVDDGEAAIAAQGLDEIGAHGDERRRSAGSAVEAAEKLLPAGLRGIVDLARRRFPAGRAETGDRVLDTASVGPEIVSQGAKEGDFVGQRKVTVAGENLARQCDAGCFAALGEERAAHLGKRAAIAGTARPRRRLEHRTAAFRDRGQKIGKEGAVHNFPARSGSPPAVPGCIGGTERSIVTRERGQIKADGDTRVPAKARERPRCT